LKIFIIDQNQEIVYQGAVDSILSADMSDIKKAKNFVTRALDELLKGDEITVKKTKPYGCSVKY